MGKTCGDCVYCGAANGLRWENSEHCNKQNISVDYDKPACAYFKDESDGCCYDCGYFKDGIWGGKCTYSNKKISNPSSYSCSHYSD